MYLRYFGLTEKPFSIAPNPEFLFLSERHKEALAHLTYGLGDAGGFVLLTGEVGTGKTTVTRSMLAQLPESTQVAFILNPSLSELELLATICDELDIEYDANNATLKSLTDVIKHRLLVNHQSGGHTMLIIDEAQHLAPEVLEQLRLLTNLETDHKKLLQIVLVGQPELQHLLQRNELRQLAQRITARYHLLPLSESQVFAYIQHRLQKAGCQQALFHHDAVAYVHQVTAGIPRLINLLADRCLLGAYSASQTQVTKAIAIQAAKEALPTNLVPVENQAKSRKPLLFSAWLGVLFLVGFGLAKLV
ncbi:ExeA family protein [Pseudoalteromonas piscicida]|uniref:ExeA family protein n=1 Tax=Pseudoalteromonas piscicida TaxID=43662 RepID=UPI0030B6B0C2